MYVRTVRRLGSSRASERFFCVKQKFCVSGEGTRRLHGKFQGADGGADEGADRQVRTELLKASLSQDLLGSVLASGFPSLRWFVFFSGRGRD